MLDLQSLKAQPVSGFGIGGLLLIGAG
jgi:hypothetical protein